MPKSGKLILKNGIEFEGEIFGAEKSSAGEVVFTTGMVGYPESLTDPSYKEQILTFTYPLIGNYGIPSETLNKQGFFEYFESEKIHVSGIVVSEYSENFSHWHAKQSLGDWLKKAGVPGITGIDTRALTKILRTHGSMPGKIVVGKDNIPLYDPNKENLVEKVSIKEPLTYKAKNASALKTKKTVLMIDCGVKNNTIRHFLNRGVNIIRVPWNYDPFTETAHTPEFDGLFVSNGPGDPALLSTTINIIKKALDKKIPTFGICLGNQLLARATGAKTYKMKFGNRSQNQPCLDTETNRCYMTTQNHGFAIKPNSLPKDWKIWFTNVNDKTVEGIKHTKLPFSAVQFHPEAKPGPKDTEFLFDLFINQL